MIQKEWLRRIAKAEKELHSGLEYVSDFIYKNPEVGMEEHLAASLLCQEAARHGFRVTRPYCDLDTAFLAELDNGPGPVIAFVAEYDALPGFGPGGGPGHACGHNWMSAVSLGTALALSKLKDCFQGKIWLIGTPAMENFSGKVDMVRRHGFDGVDVVMQPHLERFNCIDYRTLALDAVEFSFRGKASHAAVSPELAINALDAAQFTFIGLNALKSYLRRDVSIHGIISEGGGIPSVIPEHAACQFYVRALDRPYLDHVTQRVVRCAEGAAMMAGAEMSWRFFENSCDNLMNNRVLQDLLLEYWELEGLAPSKSYENETSLSSDDIGNVSRVCPTVYMEFGIDTDDEFRIHDPSAMKYVNSPQSNRCMEQVVRIMAGAALELYNDKNLLERVRLWHRKTIGMLL